jgi:hypothetical protein
MDDVSGGRAKSKCISTAERHLAGQRFLSERLPSYRFVELSVDDLLR